MTGGKRNTVKYLDTMFKNCVVTPSEIRNDGMSYFDARDDVRTPELLIKEIESFLRG